MTTSRPASVARSAARTSITPSCIHTAAAWMAIASSTERPADVGPPEDVDHVDWERDLSERSVTGLPEHFCGTGMDRHDSLAVILEELGHHVRRV